MPRKKAEPEVLQEETVQPEIAQVEETVTAEQPVLEPQVEEPAITEPVQPYGEDDVPAAAEKSESSEPEKKSFYDLDFVNFGPTATYTRTFSHGITDF